MSTCVGVGIGVVGGALVLALAAGCVPAAKYEKLETQWKEQGALIDRHNGEVQRERKRAELAEARAIEKEKDIKLLEAKLETKEIEASYAAPRPPSAGGEGGGDATLDASLAEETVADAIEGYTRNPATGGIVLDNAVLFSPGSATLRSTAGPILDKLIADLNAPSRAGLLIRVDGHTDATPIAKSGFRNNWELAAKRALAVLDYLEAHGIDGSRLYLAGFGPHRPLVASGGAETQAKNRRVEIVLVAPQGTTSR